MTVTTTNSIKQGSNRRHTLNLSDKMEGVMSLYLGTSDISLSYVAWSNSTTLFTFSFCLPLLHFCKSNQKFAAHSEAIHKRDISRPEPEPTTTAKKEKRKKKRYLLLLLASARFGGLRGRRGGPCPSSVPVIIRSAITNRPPAESFNLYYSTTTRNSHRQSEITILLRMGDHSGGRRTGERSRL